MTPTKWPHGLAIATLLFAAGCTQACSSRSPEQASEARQNLNQVADPAIAPESGAPKLDPPLPTLEDDRYTSFDLLQNRPLAHRVSLSDGARAYWADAREPDFMRYIH